MFPPKPPKGADPRMYFFLFLLTLGTTLGYQGWTLLYTNFAVESAHLSAADNGLVQSLREVPGLLGFLIIPLLLVMKEHRVAAVAALATGLGTALTGFFPSFVPVILTTLLMSFGFHFFEAVNQSLLLQYFDVRTTPVVMGKLRGLAAGGSLAASVFVFFCSDFLPYTMMFLIVGALCMFTGVWGLFLDPTNKELPIQSKKIYVNPMAGNGTFQAARAGRRRWEFGKSQALNAHNFSLLVLSNFDNPTWPPSYPMVGSLCIFLFSSPCSALLTPSPLECLLCCFFLLRAQSDLSQALPEHDLTALVP